MMIKEFWHINSSESKILEREYQQPFKGQMVVQASYSLVSTGTERLVSQGQVPETVYSSMAIPLMDGDFQLPVKYGYSMVGKVIEGDDDFLGRNVHLMSPHQTFAIASRNDIAIIPEGISLEIAVLASNMETALNALWDSEISAGDDVLICGFGIIGALTAMLVRQIPATKVFIHEINADRLKLANSIGFATFDLNRIPNNGFDVAINTSSSDKALQICIDSTAFESKIVELSWYGNKMINLRLGGNFHMGRKKIISSQVSHIKSDKGERYDLKRRKNIVFDLMREVQLDKLPFSFCAFDELPEVFRQIRDGSYKDFCTIVKYS
jgi:threonine dehydrogenase-like Zn-dependent dehydrogenase